MLDKNTRIIVEAIRNARTIRIELEDGTAVRVGGAAPREVAMALQYHFSNLTRSYGRK